MRDGTPARKSRCGAAAERWPGYCAVAPSPLLELTPEEESRLIAAADLVTLARTGVDYDYRGDVIDSHAPEMPTRFVKQL